MFQIQNNNRCPEIIINSFMIITPSTTPPMVISKTVPFLTLFLSFNLINILILFPYIIFPFLKVSDQWKCNTEIMVIYFPCSLKNVTVLPECAFFTEHRLMIMQMDCSFRSVKCSCLHQWALRVTLAYVNDLYFKVIFTYALKMRFH